MKPPKCRLCQEHHWNTEPHKFSDSFASNMGLVASNTASNKKVASNSASNRILGSNEPVRQGVGVEERATEVPGPAAGISSPETKQRWSKDKYNAYQREYMKKRRGK